MINPWHNFETSPMGLCEEPINAWIRTPANTWSNLGYIIVGIYLLFRYRRELTKTNILKLVPISAIIIGVCSFVYHASYTNELLALDNISLYILLSFILVFNLKRLFDIPKKIFWPLYSAVIFIPTIVMLIFQGSVGSILFVIFYLLAVALEITIKKIKNDIPSYKYFFLALALQLVATSFWFLDQQGIVCNPQNHFFQGHIIWHISTAISIFLLYKHYQLYFKKGSV